MRLIFNSFYALRKKRQLFNYLELMCGQNLRKTFNIEHFIDLFSFSSFFINFLFSFLFFYYLLKILLLFFGILLLFGVTYYLSGRSEGFS
jgi:hypothetical protein